MKVRFWHVGSKSWKILHSLRTNSEFTPGHRPFNPNKEGQTSVNHPFSGAMMAMLVFREGVQVVFWEVARHLQDDVKHFQYGDPQRKSPATGILEGLSQRKTQNLYFINAWLNNFLPDLDVSTCFISLYIISLDLYSHFSYFSQIYIHNSLETCKPNSEIRKTSNSPNKRFNKKILCQWWICSVARMLLWNLRIHLLMCWQNRRISILVV